MENISLNIKGLKCDTKDCGYRDDTIPASDYAKHINAECPKCGGNLLTQVDYDMVQTLFIIQKEINKYDIPDYGLERAKGTIEMDGTGTTLFNFD